MLLEFFEAGFLLGVNGEEEITDTEFLTWWNLYDKKVGKSDCLRKWKRLSKKDRKACLDATPLYVKSTSGDKQYRLHPLTYLNGKHWNDEIIIRHTTPTAEQKQQHRLSEAARLVAEYASEGDGAKD